MKNKILDLISKLNFWYVRKFFEVEKHYTFYFDLSKLELNENGRVSSDNSSFAVKILKRYPETIIEISNLQFSDGMLTFDFNVIANPNLYDVNSSGFKRFTSNIIRSIIINAVEIEKELNNEDRDPYTVESDSKRVLHEEGSAVPKERVSKRKPRKKTLRGSKELHSEVQQPSTNHRIGDEP